MAHTSTLFSYLLQIFPRHKFNSLVEQYDANRYVKRNTCWKQFVTLLLAQARGKVSLRDIATCVATQAKKLYHLGITPLARSSLADANNTRPYQLYEGFFYSLLCRMDGLIQNRKFRFKNNLYALDASTISLCLSIFPWAKFRQKKGGIKLHCLMDVRTTIPELIVITKAKPHEVSVAKNIDFSRFSDSIIVEDRGYMDFGFLKTLLTHRIHFVTRAKKNLQYTVVGQLNFLLGKGILRDQLIELTGVKGHVFDKPLRLVTYYDDEHAVEYQFLTSITHLAPATIAQIYKARWEIELFFKWIKQHLKIKTFYGTSKNAVMTQVWVAMIYYLLLAYIRCQTKFSDSLYQLTRIIQECLFDRVHLLDILSLKIISLPTSNSPNLRQLALL